MNPIHRESYLPPVETLPLNGSQTEPLVAETELAQSTADNTESLVLTKHAAIRQAIGEVGKEIHFDARYTRQNAREVVQPLRADYRKGRRLVAGLSGLALAGAQTVGALRLPLLLAPQLALRIGEAQSPLVAGPLLGTIYALWNCISAETLRTAMAQHPHMTAKIGKRAEGAVNFCEKSLPGLEAVSKEDNSNPIKRIGRYLRLGYTAIGIGVNPSVATASLAGREKREIRRIYTKSSLACGSVAALTLSGVAGGKWALEGPWPEGAELIQNMSTNKYCLVGAGILLVVAPHMRAKYKAWCIDAKLAKEYEKLAQRHTAKPKKPAATPIFRPALATS